MKTKFLFCAIILSVVITGCKKKELPDPNTNTGITAPFYFKGNIDGKDIVFEEGKNGFANGVLQTGSNGAVVMKDELTVIQSYMTDGNSMAVGIRKSFSTSPDCDQLKAMIAPGAYSYSQNDSDGAIIYYEDENAKSWNSDGGPQDNGNFEVVEYIDNTSGHSNKIVKIKFSGKLYDGSGNSITVSNAEIRGKILYCL